MSTTCDVVAERVALGESLGDAAEHATSCARCRRLAALPAELGATHREIDPGIGFAARMTAGAQQRVTVRRRRRIAAGLAATVAATTLGVFVLTREPDGAAKRVAPATEIKQDDPREPNNTDIDDDLKALVRMADTDRSSRVSANWREI